MLNFLKKLFENKQSFDFKAHWQDHYSGGGDSGAGSYGVLAEYKAEIINEFIKSNNVQSVIEFGCGDGNQLKYMNYQKYLGLDVARSAIQMCSAIFKDDSTKSFMVYDPEYFVNKGFIKADLVICLDVLYHITDDKSLLNTLQDIFSCSYKYVILYTNIQEIKYQPNSHVRHWDTMSYLARFDDFDVIKIIEQKYKHLSSASFILMERKG